MRVPWIIGNWSSGLEDNSRFLGFWLFHRCGGNNDDEGRNNRWSTVRGGTERERERDGCFELSVNFDGGWVETVAVDRPSGRVNAVHEQLPAWTTTRMIYQLRRWYIRGIARCPPPAAYRCNCHARRIARSVGRVNRSVLGGSKFRENDFWMNLCSGCSFLPIFHSLFSSMC